MSCVLDGITLPLYTSANDWPINDTFFHVEYCAADVPEDMEHTLVLTIEEDMSSRHSFVLDYIVYDASLGADVDLVPVDGGGLSRVLVDDREEDRIEYEGTWEQKGGGYGHTAPGYAASTSTTNTVGSKATLKFEGICRRSPLCTPHRLSRISQARVFAYTEHPPGLGHPTTVPGRQISDWRLMSIPLLTMKSRPVPLSPLNAAPPMSLPLYPSPIFRYSSHPTYPMASIR